MDWERVRQRLESARNYWIATASAGAIPAVSPVWGVWTDDDGAFRFFADPDSRKARNLARNPRAVVHTESGDDAIILEGTIERVPPSAEVVRAYEAKYGVSPSADAPDAAAYRLRPVKAMAWLESDFPKTATRWRFRQPPRNRFINGGRRKGREILLLLGTTKTIPNRSPRP